MEQKLSHEDTYSIHRWSMHGNRANLTTLPSNLSSLTQGVAEWMACPGIPNFTNDFLLIICIMQVLDDLNEIWQPNYISKKRTNDIRLAQREEKRREGLIPEDGFDETKELPRYGTDFIVVGPLSNDFQIATGECFSLCVYCCIYMYWET